MQPRLDPSTAQFGSAAGQVPGRLVHELATDQLSAKQARHRAALQSAPIGHDQVSRKKRLCYRFISLQSSIMPNEPRVAPNDASSCQGLADGVGSGSGEAEGLASGCELAALINSGVA